MQEDNNFDLVIIGAGPAGYVCAIRARQLGVKKIAVLENNEPGGTCLNWGCIPTKSLIHQANQLNAVKQLSYMGINVDTSHINYENVFKNSRKSTAMLSRGVSYLLKKNQIELIKGAFSFKNSRELINEEGKVVTGNNIVIATGAAPYEIPVCKFNGKNILSSKDALSLKSLPQKVLIIGSGVIGIEFAHVWSSFGVDVTVLELMDNILPMEDEECSSFIRKVFEKKNVKFFTGSRLQFVDSSGESLKVSFVDKENENKCEPYDLILVATGRKPNVGGLNLEKAGVRKNENGSISVNENFETSAKGVYAIGDVIDTLQLAHVGSKEGELVATRIAIKKDICSPDNNEIPMCIYCEPQLGRFGMTEKELLSSQIPYKKIIFPYRANGKAVSISASEGFVKILVKEETKEILGAHIVGKEATELIHQLLMVKKFNIDLKHAGEMIFAHPTLSEIIMESLRAVNDEAIHI